LTIGEVLRKQPTFLERAFQKEWPSQIRGYDKPAVLELAFRGGYPEVLKLAETGRREWYDDYIKSLLSRDLRDIVNIQRQDVMEALLNVLSAWSSKLMNIEAICSKLSVSRNTLLRYVNAIILLCLFEKVPSWIRTDYDRVGSREKLFAADTGLMAHLLNWRLSDVLLDSDKSGKIIETLVFNELRAQIDLDYHYSLFHYRDRENREIDFIVRNDSGAFLGVEVKAGSAVSREDCRHMVWFKNNIAKDEPFIGVVLYTGEVALPLGKDMYAVPIAALWS
jgi:predicted AAA+ superfamily ATPase